MERRSKREQRHRDDPGDDNADVTSGEFGDRAHLPAPFTSDCAPALATTANISTMPWMAMLQ